MRLETVCSICYCVDNTNRSVTAQLLGELRASNAGVRQPRLIVSYGTSPPHSFCSDHSPTNPVHLTRCVPEVRRRTAYSGDGSALYVCGLNPSGDCHRLTGRLHQRSFPVT